MTSADPQAFNPTRETRFALCCADYSGILHVPSIPSRKCNFHKWAGPCEYGWHIFKTTIEIADDLFARVQDVAHREKTTFRALTEHGLRLMLKEKQQAKSKRLPPLVTVRGRGLTDKFKNANWEKLRNEIYRGRGA